MLRSSADQYGAVAVSIHWLTAILILIVLGSGFNAADAIDDATKAQLLRVHIPAAIAVLVLTVLRIAWWLLFDAKPQPVRGMPLWQERLARFVHLVFYIVILGMVASGIGMMILSGAGPMIFGTPGADLPDFHDFPPRAPHGLAASLMVALLFAHVGAALYHHFIRRDGLLWRMWYWG